MKTLVTGGTGFVGRKVVEKLTRPVVLTRNVERARATFSSDVELLEWKDPNKSEPSLGNFEYETVINLMGEPIAEGRWNEDKKRRIRDSRVLGTQNLVKALSRLDKKPPTFISASAMGFYGSRGDELLTENASPGSGFLPDVCKEWESAAEAATEYGTRVVIVRIGLVLGDQGGAIEKLLPIFKMGAGGRLGNGMQWMSWIHVDDLVSAILFAKNHSTINGPVNGSAPYPVQNKDFTKILADAVHRPALIPVPKFGLKLTYGEFAETLYESQRLVPKMLLDHHFKFNFEHLDQALKNIV